jgi:hypothetical protein
MADPVAIVSDAAATCYTVRNGWSWAHIFVRNGTVQCVDGSPRNWVNLAVLSDFGYCWSHIGGDSWQGFLASLSFDYAMRKMMGPRFDAPLSLRDSIRKVRELVVDYRRTGQMSKEDARELWDAADLCGEGQSFLADLNRYSSGAMYRNELWDARWTEPSPEARGFWHEIWPHFLAAALASQTPAIGEG